MKVAIDTVQRSWLVRRLREQGWPENLVLWAGSFTTDRSVRIHLDGETSPLKAVECGLPQDSPASPMQFMP